MPSGTVFTRSAVALVGVSSQHHRPWATHRDRMCSIARPCLPNERRSVAWQRVPIGGRALEGELDVFNVLNVLNARWAHYRVADPAVLQHVGQTSGSAETSQPIFRFNAARGAWTMLPTESSFQLQLALRSRF